MQQAEEIKKDIIKHATRTIEIIYEPGKTTMTKQDKQLLAAYLELHDFELKLQKAADKMFHDAIPLTKTLDALREELTKVQATFDECCLLADKLGGTTYATGEASLEQLTESQVHTSKQILDYNEKILKAYETTEALSKEVNEYNEATEDEMNLLYDKYSEINTDHSQNWEKNSINIVTWDDEYDKFHSYRSMQEDRRRTLMEYAEAAIANYTNLNLQTTTLYNVWTEFLKRCDLLRAVAELHANKIAININ